MPAVLLHGSYAARFQQRRPLLRHVRAPVCNALQSTSAGLSRPCMASIIQPLSNSRRGGAVCRSGPPAGWETDTDVKPEPSPGECEVLCSIDSPSPTAEEAENYEPKSDLYRSLAVGAVVLVASGAVSHEWIGQHENIALPFVFVLGYAGIIFEEFFAFNKAGVALLTAVAMWTVRAAGAPSTEILDEQLAESLAEVSQVIFFLIGAMTVVETVDSHQGFKIVTDAIKTRDKRKLLWLIGGITFFMSAVLDNLTSTIVMVSLLRKLVRDPEQRKFMGAVVVIAANAGGAWTPIGDVTTTMLWINGQISALPTMRDIFLPAVVSLAVPLALLSTTDEFKGGDPTPEEVAAEAAAAAEAAMAGEENVMAPRGMLVFSAGTASLLFVPVFKQLTGLPPFMGMLFGLGSLWLLTDAIHYGEPGRGKLKVSQALSRIDTQGVLFFMGILMAISSMDSAGVLKEVATWLDSHVPTTELVALAIGLVSALIDNVPLVAATMGMYDLADYPMDGTLWQLIAYCAGTGGSILIVGSAAGVAFMGMEKADFMWYLKKVSPWALAGYLGGVGAYVGVHSLQAGEAVAAVAPLLLPAAAVLQ